MILADSGIAPSVSNGSAGTEKARVNGRIGKNSFTLRVNASSPSVLVASQTYYSRLEERPSTAQVFPWFLRITL